MRAALLLFATFAGAISLVGSLFALFSGEVGGAVLLFLIASGSGLLANRLAGSTRD